MSFVAPENCGIRWELAGWEEYLTQEIKKIKCQKFCTHKKKLISSKDTAKAKNDYEL